MEDNILKYVYTLQEIGIALNLGTEEITSITYYSNKQYFLQKQAEKIYM